MANPSIQLGTNSNWAVKEDKLLAYKEYNDYFFNKEFDFSRGTSATYVAKDGLIKTAGIQPNIVNNGDFSELGSELVTNGNFDTNSDWTTPSGSNISGGSLNFDGTQTGTINVNQIITSLDLTKIYKVTFTISNYTAGQVKVKISNSAQGTNKTANGTYTEYLSGMVNKTLSLTANVDFIGSIDNISVKEVDPNDYWETEGNSSITVGTYEGRSNVANINILNTSTSSRIRQPFNYVNGKKYKVTVNVFLVSGSFRMDSSDSFISGDFVSTSTTGSWLTLSAEIDAISTGSNYIWLRSLSEVSQFYVDSVSVQEIETDTPRIDFTNDTKGHLLLEPISTNQIIHSNGFNNSPWQQTAVNVTANAGISPDGNNNAYLIEAQNNTSQHRVRRTGSPPTTVSASIFAKKGTTDYAYFFCGGGSRAIQAIFDLSDGSVTDSLGLNATLTSASSVSLGNGWYRLQLSGSFATAPTNRIGIVPYYQSTINGNPDTAWLGSGESIYIYGAMEENNSYPTSYIPTTDATSTRNADVCNNSGSAQDFNSEEGVLYAEIAALADSLTSRVISISNSTTDERVQIAYQNVSNRIKVFVFSSSNGDSTTLAYDVSDATDFVKVAVKYKSGDYALWVDGIEVQTKTDAFTPTGLKELAFDAGNGSNDFYGKVRNVRVFTEALTDAELQELTS